MRLSYNWLREYVRMELTPSKLGEKLTMAGIEVEEILDLGASYRQIRIGQIAAISPHPEADNLLVCGVKLADGRIRVITAAKNLAPGDLIPVALPGSSLPNGKEIETISFRGIESQGMLCSEEELGLSRSSQGIMVLPVGTRLESEFPQVLGVDDTVLVLELTPDRADCLGILGIAHEVAALTGQRVTYPPAVSIEDEAPIEEMVQVEVVDPELAPRYAGRVFFDLKVGESPLWLKTRLLAAGMRPINNIVDLTNYVMLEMNQPLHAFDLDQLAERKIIVRRAKDGEKIVTLDEMERELLREDLLIADADFGQCIAGVMGGNKSEVSFQTERVFLEAANFSAVSVRRAAQRYAIQSEAALRFGKGLDPATVVPALNRVSYLLNDLGIGKTAKGVIDCYPKPESPRRIFFRPEKINSLLGTDLDPAYMGEILGRLSFRVGSTENGLWAEAPSFRRDIEVEADLAEEVARIHGYDRIPTTYPVAGEGGALTARQRFEYRMRDLLLGYGLTEVVTYSFHGQRLFDRMNIPVDHAWRKTVALQTPLSEEGSIMRSSLCGGLLEALSYNAKRKQENLRFFELAKVYLPTKEGELPHEPLYLGGVLMGRAFEEGWNQPATEIDFYDGKGILEALFVDLRITAWNFRPGAHPILHPGRAALVEIEGRPVGILGEVHPKVKRAFNLTARTVLFELNMEEVWKAVGAEELVIDPLPKFPPLLRDLAILLPEATLVREVMNLIKEIGGEWLEEIKLFDVYKGEKIPADHRSLAFSLTFRTADRTLQDEEVNGKMERIIRGLAERYEASIRQ